MSKKGFRSTDVTPSPVEFEATLVASESKIYQTHIIVPPEIAAAYKQNDVKRVVASLSSASGEVEYQCGLIPRGGGKTAIMVNKDIRAKLKIDNGSPVFVRLRKDDSEYGLEMPEELAELLRQDDEGDRLFHALTPGKRRTLLYIVASVKSSARRIERAIRIVEHLKSRNGEVDYKQLYHDLNISRRED
jgi:hypothetical protein